MNEPADFSVAGTAEDRVVAIRGDVDFSNAEQLGERIRSAAGPSGRLTIDLSAASYLDSAGLNMLFRVSRWLREESRALRVVAPPESNVRRMLQISGVPSVAELTDT